jgi:short subunit dehydrogenase-like uncharacterized protein
VSTAYYSTGIPNIEVYMAVPVGAIRAMRLAGALGPLLASPPAQALLRALVRRRAPGPSAEGRSRGLSLLWGEVEDGAGGRAASRLRTPEGYTLTALTAVLIAERVLAGELRAGFQTPSLAYGPDLIMQVDGVTREDVG